MSETSDGPVNAALAGNRIAATVAFARGASIGLSGLLWLIALYLTSLGCAFVILSATVFQSGTIQGSSDDAGAILKILRAIPELEHHVIQEMRIAGEHEDGLREHVKTLTKVRTTAEADLRNSFQGLVKSSTELMVRLPRFDGSVTFDKASSFDTVGLVSRLNSGVETELAKLADQSGEDGIIGLWEKVKVSAAEVEVARSLAWSSNQGIRDAEKRLDDVQDKIARLHRARDEIRENIFNRYEISPQVRASISQVFNTGFSPLVFLVQLPSELLTFALTVAMGLLGSTIHMSRELFAAANEQDRPGFTWFVARPLEGMAAALIIYIFFRAGQFTFTGGGTADNKLDELNPYVLSFLAIGSGLLSEEAYLRIVRGARKWLASDKKSASELTSAKDGEDRPETDPAGRNL